MKLCRVSRKSFNFFTHKRRRFLSEQKHYFSFNWFLFLKNCNVLTPCINWSIIKLPTNLIIHFYFLKINKSNITITNLSTVPIVNNLPDQSASTETLVEVFFFSLDIQDCHSNFSLTLQTDVHFFIWLNKTTRWIQFK